MPGGLDAAMRTRRQKSPLYLWVERNLIRKPLEPGKRFKGFFCFERASPRTVRGRRADEDIGPYTHRFDSRQGSPLGLPSMMGTGGPVCCPYSVSSTSTVGSAKPGAEVKPRQCQILHTQGPGGPGRKHKPSLRFCAPVILCDFSGGGPVK